MSDGSEDANVKGEAVGKAIAYNAEAYAAGIGDSAEPVSEAGYAG